VIEILTSSGFLLLGLLTGLGHCVGMCCPFVLWISDGDRVSARAGLSRLVPHLLYNLGRTLTYSALGAVAGLLGSVVSMGGALLGVQRATAIAVGALLVLYAGFSLAGMLPLSKVESLGFVDRWVGRLLGRPVRRPFLVGLLLGFLPCGPLYGALIAAAGLGSWWQGALGLALFGLGTAPALVGLGMVGNFLARHRGALHLLSLLVILGMGFWFVWQGIRL